MREQIPSPELKLIDETWYHRFDYKAEIDFILYLTSIEKLRRYTLQCAQAYDAQPDHDSKARADHLFRLHEASRYNNGPDRRVDWTGPTPRSHSFPLYWSKKSGQT